MTFPQFGPCAKCSQSGPLFARGRAWLCARCCSAAAVLASRDPGADEAPIDIPDPHTSMEAAPP